MRLKICREKYSLFLLSIFADGQLYANTEIDSHVKNCSFCSSWIRQLKKCEKQIQIYEKCRENSIVLEIFDVVNQRRDLQRLGWEPAWLGFEQGRLALLASAPAERLKFYLKFFWHGQPRLYLGNFAFTKKVILLRGRRYIPINPCKSQRIVKHDGILLIEEKKPIVEITLKLPEILKETSITRKCRSLALGSPSFIAGFFEESSDLAEITLWNHIKTRMTARNLGIYLMHLNTQASYKKIACNFQVSTHYVARLIAKTRNQLVGITSRNNQ